MKLSQASQVLFAVAGFLGGLAVFKLIGWLP